MNKNLIAISGKKGSGKDTVTKIIQIITLMPHLNDEGIESFLNRDIISPYVNKKFAAKANIAYKLITGIDYSNLTDLEKEKERPKFNSFANIHMKAAFGNKVWIDALMNEYVPYKKGDTSLENNCIHDRCQHCNDAYISNKLNLYCNTCILNPEIIIYPKWIISDLRLKSECETLIKDYNALIIRVERFQTVVEWVRTIPTLNVTEWFDNNDISNQNKVSSIYFLKNLKHSKYTCDPLYLSLLKSETECDLDHTSFEHYISNNSTLISLIRKIRVLLNILNVVKLHE